LTSIFYFYSLFFFTLKEKRINSEEKIKHCLELKKTPKILGIIPARRGSKRIPNKNIKKLLGKPMIYYTIKEAKKSKYLSKIVGRIFVNNKK